MDTSSKIQQYLQDNSIQEAITLFEQTPLLQDPQALKRPSNFKFYHSMARGYYMASFYQKCQAILTQISSSIASEIYQIKLLEFKTQYLIGNVQKSGEILNSLLSYIKGHNMDFKPHHIKDVETLIKFIQTRSRTLSRTELDLEQREEERGAFSFQGFPVFLISKLWFNKWKAYVGHDSHQLSRDHPGTISNFQIIDHSYYLLYDLAPQKNYTNQCLFTSSQYMILTKTLWKYLSQKYGGNEVKRFNISLYQRLDQTITEVWLKKIEISQFDKSSITNFVQISRKQNWLGLTKKINRIWGKQKPGKIYKSNKNDPKKLFQITSMNTTFQQQDISNVKVVFNNSSSVTPHKQSNKLTAQTNTTLQKCANCGKTSRLAYCQCKTIKYCDIDCLSEHRSKHRKDCQTKLQQQVQRNQIVTKFNLSQNVRFGNKRGLVGLRNLGNTCYMNSGIQCLSNTQQLSEFFMSGGFLEDLNVRNPLGSNGYMTCCYSKLVREIWSGTNSDVSPWQLKKAISKFSPQFSGFGQHDSQELISTLIDGLHEDVNKIKVKPTIQDDQTSGQVQDEILSQKSWHNYRSRNLSFVSSLFTGQFKSTLKCPNCKRISISFDPFMLISLPIPLGYEIYLYFISKSLEEPAQRIDFTIHLLETVSDVISRLRKIFNISNQSQLKIVEIDRNYQIKYVFNNEDVADLLYKSKEMIFCYEIESNNSPLYTIKYYSNVLEYNKQSSTPSYELRTFPRLYKSQQKPSSEIILNSIKRAIKTQSTTYLSSQSYFSYSFQKQNQIKVLLKQNLKLASYKQTKIPQQIIDLNSCFNLFTKQQKLDKNNSWYCNKCKQFVEANKHMQIYNTNKILVIGLKRFKINKKIKCFIKYPLNGLDLTNYVVGGYKNNQSKGTKDRVIYDLYAVSNHYGSLGGGHYTAYCKNFLTNKWYEFNDSRYSEVREEEVVSSNAYVLFYRKRATN